MDQNEGDLLDPIDGQPAKFCVFLIMNWSERIVSDRDVLLGKPLIKGTRISVEFILEGLADGWNEDKIRQSYPHLKKEDMQAVFSFSQ